jgi:1-acyl-sn-glycerol-3-phosphate acyltransferase
MIIVTTMCHEECSVMNTDGSLLCLSWACWIQSTPSCSVSIPLVLILYLGLWITWMRAVLLMIWRYLLPSAFRVGVSVHSEPWRWRKCIAQKLWQHCLLSAFTQSKDPRALSAGNHTGKVWSR